MAFKVVVLALVCLAAIGNAQTYTSVADAATKTPDLSILLAAVKATGLAGALSDGTVALTVFAPTNAAFTAAATALGTTPAALLGSPYLKSILSYHVVPAAAKAADLTNGQSLPTLLTGKNLTVAISGSTVTIVGAASNATVTTADVPAGNGVVHVVDTVLLPAAPASFSTLPAAPTPGPALAAALAGLAPAPATAGSRKLAF
jgi:uncharacterized surface protein with fasciclin (FAS1) repeats